MTCVDFVLVCVFFFFQAEDGIRDSSVTGVQTCALPIFNLAGIFKQATFWRSRRAGTVLVVSAAMARAHEQIRLCEPANWTSEVRAIDREDLELLAVNIPYPAGDIRCFSVPGIHDGIAIFCEPRLASVKLIKRTKREPGVISRLLLAADGR